MPSEISVTKVPGAVSFQTLPETLIWRPSTSMTRAARSGTLKPCSVPGVAIE